MEITLTLNEVLQRCNDWDDFCEKEKWSIWACNEGGGGIEVSLTEEKAKEYGIIKQEPKNETSI